MAKQDWAERAVLRELKQHDGDRVGELAAWLIPQDIVKLLRAERARSRRVVRKFKLRMAKFMSENKTIADTNTNMGYQCACDDILEKLR